MNNKLTAPPAQPWYETCDLYDFVGSCEATMTEAEKREYRNYLRDLDRRSRQAPRAGKPCVGVARLLARVCGFGKPAFRMEPVTVEELCPKE